jgi:hypothetical protein
MQTSGMHRERKFLDHVNNSQLSKKNIVTHRTIAGQRLAKHIPAGTNMRNNRMSIARQRISTHAEDSAGQ